MERQQGMFKTKTLGDIHIRIYIHPLKNRYVIRAVIDNTISKLASVR